MQCLKPQTNLKLTENIFKNFEPTYMLIQNLHICAINFRLGNNDILIKRWVGKNIENSLTKFRLEDLWSTCG